jgi:mono/diheme cytochrome c family protein
MNALKLAVIVAALTLAIAACGESTNKPNVAENTSKPVAPATPSAANKAPNELAAAKELYAVNCQICHRDTGKGGEVTVEGKKLKPEDLTSDKIKKRDDAKLLKDITDGYPDEGMPAFKGKLSEDQIKQVIKHIRALQGAGSMATS